MVCFCHLFIGAMLPGGRNTFVQAQKKKPARFVQLLLFVCFLCFYCGNLTKSITRTSTMTAWHAFTSQWTHQNHSWFCGRRTPYIVPVITGGSRLGFFPLHLWSLQGAVLISIISTGGFCCHLLMLSFLYPCDDRTQTSQQRLIHSAVQKLKFMTPSQKILEVNITMEVVWIQFIYNLDSLWRKPRPMCVHIKGSNNRECVFLLLREKTHKTKIKWKKLYTIVVLKTFFNANRVTFQVVQSIDPTKQIIVTQVLKTTAASIKQSFHHLMEKYTCKLKCKQNYSLRLKNVAILMGHFTAKGNSKVMQFKRLTMNT